MFKSLFWAVPTLLIAFGSASSVMAKDDHHGYRSYRAHSYSQPSFTGTNGLPSYVRGIGTYAGGLSAARFGGSGIYFSAQGGGAYLPDSYRKSTVEPRIIRVNQRTLNDSCHYEAGVCVIRP